MNNEQLERLATAAGLSVHWVDANARPQTVSLMSCARFWKHWVFLLKMARR